MSKKKQKKEQELRKKLINQGFSEKDVEKILSSQRKKKSIFVTVTLAFATVIIISGVVVAVKKYSDKNNELTNDGQKAKEADEKLKQDIKNDKPDKNPNDIVIPDNTTKEEKEKLEEEKKFWEATLTLKSTVENCIKRQGLGSQNFVSVRRINNIYEYNKNTLIVDCDYLYTQEYSNNSFLRQTNAYLVLENTTEELKIEDMSSLINFINDKNTDAGLEVSYVEQNISNLSEFYENHIKEFVFKNYIQQGYSVSLEKITYGNYFKESPINFKCITKVSKDDEVFYIINQINSSKETENLSKDEWVKFATTKGSDTERIFVTSTEKWGALNFDWKALSEEYSGQKTQEAQAQAIIDSFSTFDENGDLETFDYPAYQEYKKQKEAEKEAKELEQNMTQEAKVTYTEQELGF